MEPAKKKRTLYNIVADYEQLLFTIEENEGVVEDELIGELANHECAFEQKVDRVLMMHEMFEGQATRLKQRADRLAAHAKVLQNRSDRLKELVRLSMIQLDVRKMTTDHFPSIYLMDTESVGIKDEKKLLEEFGDPSIGCVSYPPKISKAEVKKLLRAFDQDHVIHQCAELQKKTALVVR